MLKRNTNAELMKLIPILETSSKNNVYVYGSEKDFRQGQMTLLEVGLQLISYLEDEDNIIRENCWKALIALISRGEFDLTRMTLSSEERECLQSNNLPKLLSMKL